MAVKVPPAVRELQGNSERWRQRATNVGMDPEAMGGPWLAMAGDWWTGWTGRALGGMSDFFWISLPGVGKCPWGFVSHHLQMGVSENG